MWPMHDALHAGIKFLVHLQEGKPPDPYWDKLMFALHSGLAKLEAAYNVERRDGGLGL